MIDCEFNKSQVNTHHMQVKLLLVWKSACRHVESVCDDESVWMSQGNETFLSGLCQYAFTSCVLCMALSSMGTAYGKSTGRTRIKKKMK